MMGMFDRIGPGPSAPISGWYRDDMVPARSLRAYLRTRPLPGTRPPRRGQCPGDPRYRRSAAQAWDVTIHNLAGGTKAKASVARTHPRKTASPASRAGRPRIQWWTVASCTSKRKTQHSRWIGVKASSSSEDMGGVKATSENPGSVSAVTPACRLRRFTPP